MNENQNNNESDKPSSLSFWQELKRRKVTRVGTVYLITGWLIIQVAETSFASFGIPEWGFRLVTLMVLLGLPVALILAWALELTPEGIKTTQALPADKTSVGESGTLNKKRNWTAYALGALLPTLILGSLAMFFYVQANNSGAESDGAGPRDEAGAATRIAQSIAVMPLVNMSSDEENAYFAGGIHEDVLTNLSRIEDLQVISRTSMLRYATSDKSLREIGAELGVDYIVEGSVRRIGNHVRVTIQLIDADNDLHLWANNFERELVDVFATQSELAKEISDSLHLELQPESVGTLEGMPTFSVKAYDLFVRAAGLEKTEGETEESVIQRRAMLEEAVIEDPDFVEAWAVLKRLYDLQLDRLRRQDWYLDEGENKETVAADIRARSKRALDKAIALDPDNVETLLARAVNHVRIRTEEERQEQKRLFDQIIAISPENAKAWYHLGFWYTHLVDLPEHDLEALTADAAAAFEEALRLDPFNARTVGAVLTWYRDRGFEEDVARLAERLNQIIPDTAADRRLARVSWSFKRGQIVSAFMQTADEALIDEYRKGWQEAIDTGDYAGSSSILRYWHEARLTMFEGDMDRFIELSRIRFDLNEGGPDPIFFSILKSTSMVILIARGDLDEARRVAQSILDQEEVLRTWDLYECSCFLGALAHAHAVLGDMDEARRLIEELLDDQSLYQDRAIRFIPYMDTEQGVEFAFSELAKNPNWDGFDEMAAEYLWNLDFLAHPRVQDYYAKEGKWIDYLSARVPEYAKYKRVAAE